MVHTPLRSVDRTAFISSMLFQHLASGKCVEQSWLIEYRFAVLTGFEDHSTIATSPLLDGSNACKHQVFHRMKKFYEFMLFQVSKSRPGAPNGGTKSSCQKPRTNISARTVSGGSLDSWMILRRTRSLPNSNLARRTASD